MCAMPYSIAHNPSGAIEVETADVALMADDLLKLPEAISLARRTVNNRGCPGLRGVGLLDFSCCGDGVVACFELDGGELATHALASASVVGQVHESRNSVAMALNSAPQQLRREARWYEGMRKARPKPGLCVASRAVE